MPETPTADKQPIYDMFEQTYWEVQKVLDGVLGTSDGDGAGEGIIADVYAALDKAAANERARIADWMVTLADASVDKSRPLRTVLEEVAGMIRTYQPKAGDRS